MTIIFQTGNSFWIEELNIPRSAVGANTIVNTDQLLERQGVFLTAAATIDTNTAVDLPENQEVSVSIRRIDNADLVAGQNITGIKVRRYNDNATEETFGVKVVVFMRGSGH